ncbi:MAG: hypothetical protein V8P98_00230 [Acutalibacteraceae bacterium]
MLNFYIDGTPCAVKVACTVWSGGKSGEHSKDYLSLLISALLEAIPEYIEVTTGMAIPQQNTGPLINTVSRLYCSCGITRNNQKVKNYKEQ